MKSVKERRLRRRRELRQAKKQMAKTQAGWSEAFRQGVIFGLETGLNMLRAHPIRSGKVSYHFEQNGKQVGPEYTNQIEEPN
jgi:hypothetical protein